MQGPAMRPGYAGHASRMHFAYIHKNTIVQAKEYVPDWSDKKSDMVTGMCEGGPARRSAKVFK